MAGSRYVALATLLAGFALSLSPVEIKGAKLFTTDDGNQFFVKGTDA